MDNPAQGCRLTFIGYTNKSLEQFTVNNKTAQSFGKAA
jgi:hypothetical protein